MNTTLASLTIRVKITILTIFNGKVVFFCKKTEELLVCIIYYDFICTLMFVLINYRFCKCPTK